MKRSFLLLFYKKEALSCFLDEASGSFLKKRTKKLSSLILA
jgi:hypothetical protein